jgi:hypothetical protein
MTLKKALGLLQLMISIETRYPTPTQKKTYSIPLAEEKSVPVFFNDFMAARMPCTAATHETSEKTEESVSKARLR